MLAANLWVFAPLSLPLVLAPLLGGLDVYEWADPEGRGGGRGRTTTTLIAHKTPFLNPIFFFDPLRHLLRGVGVAWAGGSITLSKPAGRDGGPDHHPKAAQHGRLGPAAVRPHRHVRGHRLPDEPDADVVQHDLRRLPVRRVCGERARHAGDLRCCCCAKRGLLTQAVTVEHQHDLGNAAVRVHRVLGVYRVQPVLADLVRGHPRRDRILPRPAGGGRGGSSPGCCWPGTSSSRSWG